MNLVNKIWIFEKVWWPCTMCVFCVWENRSCKLSFWLVCDYDRKCCAIIARVFVAGGTLPLVRVTGLSIFVLLQIERTTSTRDVSPTRDFALWVSARGAHCDIEYNVLWVVVFQADLLAATLSWHARWFQTFCLQCHINVPGWDGPWHLKRMMQVTPMRQYYTLRFRLMKMTLRCVPWHRYMLANDPVDIDR